VVLRRIPQELGLPFPDDLPQGSSQRVIVREKDGVLVPVGDEGVGEVIMAWRDHPCAYTAWLSAGTSLSAAAEYASRF
jgi:hypothetical protein